MKKYLSIFLVCFTAFVFADEHEECSITFSLPFTYDCEEGECEDGKCKPHTDGLFIAIGDEEEKDETTSRPVFEETESDKDKFYANISRWTRDTFNFGMEKIVVRFPQKAAISQSHTLLSAYAYDHAVMYRFSGYYPPMGNIDPIAWFDEIRYNASDYPYNLISSKIIQTSNGYWLMDYIVHDYVQNQVIKARAIVTPFNGYILECVKQNGEKDHFNYFLDNFWIHCECDD